MSNRRVRGANGLTAVDIESRLSKKFAAPEFAFLPQINQGTGAHAGRRADAVAMSVWPSRGLNLHGFEIKVGRGDFLGELKQPEKAEAIQRYCHFWWIVADKDVIRDGDILPPTWGWMEAFGVGLTVKKQAPMLTPEPWTPPFVASLLRGACELIPQLKSDYIPVSDLEVKVAERVAYELERRDPAVLALTALQERVSLFEAASGVSISKPWGRPNEIGAVVKAVMDRDLMRTLRHRVKWQRDAVREVVRRLDALCAEDESLFGPLSDDES
jgi:hypothetical protein